MRSKLGFCIANVALDSVNPIVNGSQGIIVGFRSLLESYALVIPYYKLSLYKGKAEEYSIYRDNYFIKIRARSKDSATHKFVKKVMSYKAEQFSSGPEDM